MTQEQWLECRDPEAMLAFLRDKASARKLRLFACACCRRRWQGFQDGRCRRAVELSERYAEGQANAEELAAARSLAAQAHQEAAERAWQFLDQEMATSPGLEWAVRLSAAAVAVACLILDAGGVAWDLRKACESDKGSEGWQREFNVRVRTEESRDHAGLLHDLFGNPLHPLPARSFPAEVRGLAEVCYAALPEQSPDLAVLADALADLDEQKAATHLRQLTHFKGCHVLDWLLGRG
jgi:hypothetical protein